MALVKPKKKTTVSAWGGKAPNSIASGASRALSAKPVGFSAPSAGTKPTVTQAPKPVAPTLAPVPKIAVGPPAPTLQSGADRINTNYSYGNTVGDINTQLRSLAAGYGAAPKVTQYGYDPTKGSGGDTASELDVAGNQPGSTMEVLMRNLGLTKGNINDSNLADNTFFSSRRLDQLGSADAGFAGDAAAAKRAYDDAVGALTAQLLGARGTRNTNLSAADIADIQNAASAPPEAQSGNAPAPVDPWNDPNVDWAAVHAAFDPQPMLRAGGSGAQGQPKKPKKK